MTDTDPWNRLETQSSRPSGESCIMSGLPPTAQVVSTWFVSRSMTEMLPASLSLTYSRRASRLTCSPWAPRPVGRNRVSAMATGSMIDTPSRSWLAT